MFKRSSKVMSGRLFAIIVLTTAFLSPLLFTKIGGVNITASDLAIISLALLIIFVGRIPPLPPFYWLLSIIALIGGGFSTLMAVDIYASLAHWVQYGFILFVAIPVGYYIGYRPELHVYIIYGYVLAGLYLLFQSYTEITSGAAQFVAAGRYAGDYGSVGSLAFSLACIIPFIAVAPAFARELPARIFLSTLALGTISGLLWLMLHTASRTGLLCLIVTFLIMLFMALRNSARDGGSQKSLMVVMLCGVAAFVWWISASEVYSFAYDRIQNSSADGFGARGTMLMNVKDRVDVRSVVIGVGFQGGTQLTDSGFRPHNALLLFLIEGGIIFFISLAIILLIMPLKSIRALKKGSEVDKTAHLFVVAGLCAFASYFIIMMFNTQSLHRLYWLNYGLFIGVARYLQLKISHRSQFAVGDVEPCVCYRRVV